MRYILACTILAVAMGLTGCGGGSNTGGTTDAASTPASNAPAGSTDAPGGDLNIKGSDTMVNLTQAWAETYMNAHSNAQIAVTGGGSGTGIAALQNHTADVAMSSRDIKDSEKSKIEGAGGKLHEFTVARDALTVGVHPSNTVKSLTFDQLSDIYSGKITDWGQVGGKPGKIVALSREKSSGTHVFFLEHVVRKGDSKSTEEFAPAVLMMPSSQAIADELAKNVNAIGYYGLGYHNPDKVQGVAISLKAGEPAVPPSLETVISGKYPISRPLHLYTAGEPTGLADAFIDYTLTPEGQKLVEEQG
ncbi:MAG: hypothetical protein K0Q72_2144, partial [Armatimonadetes bacterium]|nr:hypothetical protein [Armatimonadota bacterium]